jgi:hypothetical protein
MTKPLLVLTAVFALGLLYVVFPVMLQTFLSYRKSRQVSCPEEKKMATIHLDAQAAAFAAARGKTKLQIRDCSLWPKEDGCARGCLAQMS